MKPIFIIIFAIAVVITGCADENDDVDKTQVMQNDPVATDTLGTTTGKFTSYAHNLQGSAKLVLIEGNSAVLRFENFTVTAGPDVHVFLSKSSNYTRNSVIEIAVLSSGYANSNINFPLDGISYTDDYKFVLVYCIQFNSLFGYTELK